MQHKNNPTGHETLEFPFAGEPATTQFVESGEPGFKVTAKSLTPGRRRLADLLGLGACLSICASAIASMSPEAAAQPFWAWPIAAFGPLFFKRQAANLFAAPLKTTTEVVFTKKLIRVRRGLRRQSFDRALPHRFLMLAHDRALDERERHEFAARIAQQGQLVRKKKYYGHSYHIVLEYLGQRNDLLTVYGRKDALAILARLKAVDETVDRQAITGEQTLFRPRDEWAEQPGGIPRTLPNKAQQSGAVR